MRLVLLATTLALALGGCVTSKTNLAEAKMCSSSISPSDRNGPMPYRPRSCSSNPWAQSDAIAAMNWRNLSEPHGEQTPES